MSVSVSLKVVGFEKEMRRVRREAEKLANNEIAAKVDLATKTLREVTPVDTGKARSGWNTYTVKEMDGTNGAVIENKVPYIGKLNKGHSQQAPKYFIEQVLSTVGVITDEID